MMAFIFGFGRRKVREIMLCPTNDLPTRNLRANLKREEISLKGPLQVRNSIIPYKSP